MLDKLLSLETGIPVFVAEQPLDCVVRGTGKTLEDLERLKEVLINSRKKIGLIHLLQLLKSD